MFILNDILKPSIVKNLPVLLVFVAMGLSSCIAERDFVVEHDYSYRGKFQKYKTFNFLDVVDANNSLADSVIKIEIEKKMASQGYKLSSKPSILIAFKVYDSSMKFLGYNQMDMESWNLRFGYIEENETNEEALKEAKYTKHMYQLDQGTLLIDFIDSKTHSVIWQGYASGIFNDQTYLSKDTKYAVRTILNQYKMLAYEQGNLN